MLNSGRIVRITRTQSIRCYECREERRIWWFTTKSLPSKRRREKSMWVIRGFEFRQFFFLSLSLSLSLALSELEFWSAGVVCLLLISSLPRNLFFIAFLSSDQIKLGFLWFFLLQKSRIGRKITFNYCYFLTNFIDISLCAYPMHRSPFLKKVSAPITSGECFCGR